MGLFKNFISYFGGQNQNMNTRGAEDGDVNSSNSIINEQEELDLDIKDEDLISRSKELEDDWNAFLGEGLNDMRDLCYNYWLGEQQPTKNLDEVLSDKNPPDNVIYEALETYLPMVTKIIPEPVITTADNSEASIRMSSNLRSALIHLSSKYNLRMKMKKMERYRNLYMLGVIKMGWDATIDELSFDVVHPKDMILEKDAIIDENGEYTGEIAGQIRREKASNLIIRFPKMADFIKEKANNKMGTKLVYREFWTDEMVWWVMDGKVLSKKKNPFYNYEDDVVTVQEVDEYGELKSRDITARNFFPNPKKPYIFHAINSMEHPCDETNSVLQAIPLQDIVNKRTQQVDYNADNANGGLVVSGQYFDKEMANEVQRALRKNRVVFQKDGKAGDGVWRDTGRALPTEIQNQLIYATNRIKDLFGVAGSTASGTKGESTVRGKIIAKESDSDRNSDPTSWIELAYKNIFCYMLQIMFVYYDLPHSMKIIGKDKTMELVTLSRTKLWELDFDVSVKEGSLIPRDPLTQRNEAIDLYEMGAMDLITLFNKLEYPNPVEMARRSIQFKLDPVGYLQGDTIENSIQRYLANNPDANINEVIQKKVIDITAENVPNKINQGQEDTNINGSEGNLIDKVPLNQ